MAYTPRLTAPSTSDKRWINTGYGGYNRCIVVNSNTGSVIPNCTGYVHGRWMELGNTNTDYDLSLGNANTYYSHKDGFERGQEPRLGAIACYNGGEAGHVCVVEQIVDENTIVCSESDYGGDRFSVRTRYRQYGWRPSAAHTGGFAGFIYHPDIKDTPTPPLPETYFVKVTNGTASAEKGHAGDKVTITARIKQGQYFKRWHASSGTIEDIYSPQTTFTFGESNANIAAIIGGHNPYDMIRMVPYQFVKHRNKY